MMVVASSLPLLLLLVRGVSTSALPSIIHIMADDTGYNDLGYKNKLVATPRLDQLAKEGVVLTNHHAFKVCGPSRSSFHTGRLPWQMGYYDNSGDAVPWLNTNTDKFAVSKEFKLVPELLASKGYKCHAVGKWHLGHCLRAYTPTYRGYLTWLGYYSAMTEDYWLHTHSAASSCPGPIGGLWSDMSNNTGRAMEISQDKSTYESTLFGDRAVEIIANHSVESPLFLYLAFHNEHDPHQAPKSSIDRFTRIKSDTYKVTASQLTEMDEQVGRVLDALEQKGMLNNTIISFTSDNGGPLDHANNWPLRGGKHTFYEGGLRTEAFMWSHNLPKNVKGSTYDGLMHLADWRATYAVGVAGMTFDQLSDGAPFGNESKNIFNSILSRRPSPRNSLIHQVHSPRFYPGNCSISTWGSRNCPAVVTLGDLKLMMGYVGDPRRIPLDEHSNSPISFGKSGGKCGIGGFSERCSAPGKGGRPQPQPSDPTGCLHGCLFNITADPAEKYNLIQDKQHANAVYRMKEMLQQAGDVAPPWLEAQELVNEHSDEVAKGLCNAAHKMGGVMPIDA